LAVGVGLVGADGVGDKGVGGYVLWKCMSARVPRGWMVVW
jgi:hypothetical protein